MKSIIVIAILHLALAFNNYKSIATIAKKYDNPKQLYFDLHIIIHYDLEYNSDQVCDQLQAFPLQTASEQYYAKLISNSIEECQIDYPVLPTKEADDFETFYYQTHLAILTQDYTGCEKLADFIGTGGAGKPNRKKPEDSYRIAAQLYYLSSLCYEHNQLIESVVSIPLQTALINIQEVYDGVNSLIDRDNSVATTAQFLYSFLQFNTTNQQADDYFKNTIYQNTIINLLYESTKKSSASSIEKYWIIKALNHPKIKDTVIVITSKQHILTNNVGQISIKFINLQGSKVQAPKDMSATLWAGTTAQEVKYVPTPKSKEYSGYFEANTKGNYNLVIDFTTYKITHPIRIVERVIVDEVSFSIVNSKSQKPGFQYSVEDSELYPATLSVTEKSYLHVIFKLKNKVTPQQVAVRLIHPTMAMATTQVSAEFDTKRNIYYTIIDFGDPDHISTINAQYDVELMLADPLIEPKRWRFLKLDCKFQTQTPPYDESAYKLDPIIRHHFQAEAAEVPLLFVSFFIGVIAIIFIFYISIYRNMDINFDKIPDTNSKYIVYLFIILLVLLFMLLLVFWVSLNLIETISVLGILSIPLFLVGNFALLQLRKQVKQD